jgi:hypothetical protein
MHGKLLRNLDEKMMDTEQSYRWLKSGDIKRETASTIVGSSTPNNQYRLFKNKILRKKLRIYYGYVNNMKKLLTN